MKSRRIFFKETGIFALGTILLPTALKAIPANKIKNAGIQLYSVRKEMLTDAVGTLKLLAALGYKQIESAGSEKGSYYGLTPKEMKNICAGLGMTLRSGHIHIDDQWQKTLSNAVESGQEYLVCSVMPTTGQTIDNYKKTADIFNKCGDECNKANIKFGYHNHESEFEKENGMVLYDVLLSNTDPALVHMELDLGWVIATGNDPINYFKKYPGRFPLWHLKDMDIIKKQSVEFGKGGLDIPLMFANAKLSGMKYFMVEQEEYSSSALESLKLDISYLNKLRI